MSLKLFSQKDDEVLKELYSTLINKELVDVFNGQFSANQIKNRAKALHLTKDSSTKKRAQDTRASVWEDWEKEIIRRHYPKESVEGCKKYLPHRSEMSIKHKAGRMGVRLDYDVFCKNRANGPKEHSEESKQKMSASRIGIPKTDEFKRYMSDRMSGEGHPNWQGGISFEEYPKEFNERLKRRIRRRDKNTCQRCGKKKQKRNLSVHHIDYNKQNIASTNLISLCLHCHNHHHLSLSDSEKNLETQFFLSMVAEESS